MNTSRCYLVETGNGKDNSRKEIYVIAKTPNEVLEKLSKDEIISSQHKVVYKIQDLGTAII